MGRSPTSQNIPECNLALTPTGDDTPVNDTVVWSVLVVMAGDARTGGLRVVWDPAIDGGIWPGPLVGRSAVAGEAWLGSLGLLGRLETELGCGGLHPSSAERASDLAAKLTTRTGWWRDSYDADPLGTCRRLLRDRDTLVLWGWQGEAASDRLAELWAVTSLALPGIPDRLLAVHAALAERATDIESIAARSPLAVLPPLWTRLFSQLASTGVAVTEELPTTASSTGDLARARSAHFEPAGDGSLRLLRPHGPLAAADEIAASLAALPSLDGVLVVGGDEILDAALARHGLPRLGAATPPPASASLVRLVIEAAFEPMEATDLHALLCLDPGPVPRRVASRLIGALQDLPSRRSAEWREALADGLACCDDSWRSEVAARLDALLSPAAGRTDAIATAEIGRRLQVVASWARARATANPSLHNTAALADRARRLLELSGKSALSLVALRRLCDELDGNTVSSIAHAGLAEVSQPGAVLAPARSIIWWNFTRESAPTTPRLRLSTAERDNLRALGVTPPDLGQLMESSAREWRRPLDMATDSLVLVCPLTNAAGDPSFPHPLWDELRSAMPEVDAAVLLEATTMPAVRRITPALRPLPTAALVVNTGSAIALRDVESPSSLERLIGCSMAWALHYRGRLYPGRSVGPSAPSPLLYGRLAHRLLAQVFADGAISADDAAARALSLVDHTLPALCESLELPRYQLERTMVKQAVVRTAHEVGALIAAMGATVLGTELAGTGRFAGVDVAGTADLVLAHPATVIDFKWGGSGCQKKLETGTALQLASYAEMFATDGTHPEVAYITLRKPELLSSQDSTLPARKFGSTTTRATLTAAKVSIADRRVELAEGILEAPGATGLEITPVIVGNRLVLDPGCKYCSFASICGKGGCE